MKFANIVPVRNLKLSDEYNDMHLLLYHWALKSSRYVNFMKKSKVYKILDNSFYELRTMVDYDDLIRMAKKMDVQEIVAPDKMYDFKKTKSLIEDFLPKVPCGIKVQGVVCGKDKKDLIKCYNYLNNNESIDVIAFSKHGCTINKECDHYQSRKDLMESITIPNKDIHMLGINDLRELFNHYNYPVRSIDGKLLAKLTNFNQKIDWNTRINSIRLRALFDMLECLKFSKMLP